MTASFRSRLGRRIASFIALKKALGRRFFSESYTLAHLDRFLAARRLGSVTPSSFAAWTMTFAHTTPTTRRARMRVVRQFCIYLRRTDSRCFVPDPHGFPAPHTPRRAHIFTREQITSLIQTATKLPARSRSRLRAEVFRLAVVLLYTAGLRRNEVVRLAMSDYNAEERSLPVPLYLPVFVDIEPVEHLEAFAGRALVEAFEDLAAEKSRCIGRASLGPSENVEKL